jgi:hypothetical protein
MSRSSEEWEWQVSQSPPPISKSHSCCVHDCSNTIPCRSKGCGAWQKTETRTKIRCTNTMWVEPHIEAEQKKGTIMKCPTHQSTGAKAHEQKISSSLHRLPSFVDQSDAMCPHHRVLHARWPLLFVHPPTRTHALLRAIFFKSFLSVVSLSHTLTPLWPLPFR